MAELLTDTGEFTDEFRTALPEMLGDEHKDSKVMENVKDLKTLVLNHANTKSAYDKKMENIIQRPAADADDTVKADFVKLLQKELGAPDNAGDYDLSKLIDGDSPMLPKEAAEKLAEIFHNHGSSKAAVAAVTEAYMELWQAAINQQTETETKSFNEAVTKYQGDLPGDKGTVNTRSAIDAMRKFNKNNPDFLKELDESKFYDNPSDLNKLRALGMSVGDLLAWSEIAKELGVSHSQEGHSTETGDTSDMARAKKMYNKSPEMFDK